MSRQDTFDRILMLLHEAALNDSRWPAAAALIDEVCEMAGSALAVGKGPSLEEDGQVFWARFCHDGQRDEEQERWYFDNYYLHDERPPRVTQLPDSYLGPIRELYTPSELKTSRAYNEALLQGGYQNGLNVRLDGPDGSSIAWNLADSTDPAGWQLRQTGLIKRLLPHIRQFVVVRHELAGAKAVGASLEALLDNMWIGVIQLDPGGRIVEMNDRARRLLRPRRGLFDQEMHLRALSPEDNAGLQVLLAGALPRFGGRAVSGSMAIRRSPGVIGSVVHVTPLGRGGRELHGLPVAALVFVVEPRRQPGIPPELVAAALGLTPAESRVAASLAAGKSVHQIAVPTGRQENSVRFLLKSIYRRLGIRGQVELVRLVQSLRGFPGSRR